MSTDVINENEKDKIKIPALEEIISKINEYQSKNLFIISQEIFSFLESVLSFLETDDNKTENSNKLLIIKYFKFLIVNIPYNIAIMHQLKSVYNKKKFYQIIIKEIIFFKNDNKEYLQELHELFLIFLKKTSHNLNIYKEIFSYISNFLNSNILNDNSKISFDKEVYYRILQLIHMFYQVVDIESPCNYFYFNNDTNGYITITNNKQNILRPNENLNILLFVKLLDIKYLQALENENIELNLVNFKCEDKNTLINICLKELPKKDNTINITYDKFVPNKTNIILIKLKTDFNVDIFINGKILEKKDQITTKDNKQNKLIRSIELFKNFIGQCSTIMLYKNNNEQNNNLLEFLLNKLQIQNKNNKSLIDPIYEDGIYKEELFISFIKAELSTLVTKENILDSHLIYNENLNPFLKQFISNNLISIYIPTRVISIENKIILKDSINYFDAALNSSSKIFSGVYFIENEINNFKYQIGGINHLLPLVEIMINDNKLLTKENLAMFMNIIIFLFSNHENLINREKNSNFFYILSHFLEKIPEVYFEEINANFKALSLLLSSLNINNNSIFQQYRLEFFINILMNSKILFKFSLVERELIFELIAKSLNIKNAINIDIKNIINILLQYDKMKYKKYCCKEHSKLFDEKSDNDIMNPELKEQIKPIISIIDLLFKQFILEVNNYVINDEKCIARNKLQTVFEILTFDVSPCIQESILKLFFDYILKGDEKYFRYLNINDKIIKTCLFLYKNSFYNIKKYLFDCFIMLISNKKYRSNNMIQLIEKYAIFYYPLKESQNNNIKTNIEINKNKYILITYTEEQKKLLSAININSLNELYENIFIRALYYLKQKTCININLKILISITSKINSIILTNKFLMQLKDILDYEEIYNNNKFLHFVLEINYRVYIIKTYSKEFSGEINNNDISDEEKQKLLNNITSLSTEILLKIFMKNIYKIDYLITWSKYYYQIKSEKNKFESIRKYILNTFLLPLIEQLISTQKTEEILYLCNIMFEFYTYYKIKVSVGGMVKDIENLYQEICLPFKYGLLSEITKTKNDSETALLSEKWVEYPKIKNLYKYFENILSRQKKYGDEKKIFECYISNKRNMFIKELKLLFNNDNKKDLCNKGTELIFMIYHFYTLFLTVINDKIEFKEILNDFRNFILLIIISSCTLCIDKNEWPKDVNVYKNVQNIIKIILLSVFDFILNRITEIDQGLQNIQKKAKNDTEKDHFESIKNYLINTLCLFLKILNTIYREVRKEKQKKENTRFIGIFSSLKSMIFSDTEGIQLSGSYLFINELYENCINEKEINNEGQTFINYDKKNFLDELPVYTLNSINEINFDSNKENISVNEIITKNFIDNEKIKNYFNDFYEKNIKILFPFIKYIPIRQNLVNNIIPVYDNSIYVDFKVGDLILVPNYIIELKDDKIDKDIIDLNKEIVELIRLYKIQKDFSNSDKISKYRKIKKKLFSFNNIYSCEKLFYDKKDYQLKYKLLNRMTNDYVRIFLTPIIDIDYYLPKFSKFEISNLFRENSNNTTQINKITDLSISDKNIGLLNNDTSEEKLNGLFLIKEAEYKSILDLDKNIDGSIEHYKLFRSFINKKHYISNSYYNNLEDSCLVKDRYHIRGFFYSNKFEIGFYSYDKIPRKNFKDYDNDRRSCFGSVFEPQNKKYNNFYINISYDDIILVLKRRYYYKICAIEIYTIYNKSYLFKFDPKNFNDVFDNIRHYLTPNILDITIEYSKFNSKIGFINLNSKNYNIHKNIYEKNYMNLKNIYERWRKWEISTLKLLMLLNIYSNRSYNDINQYPVFPWILIDYTSENLSKLQNSQLRNLENPMGMLDYNEDAKSRKNDYIEHWNIAEDDEDKEENYDRYGSHYSTALYVSYYLVRIFPFANIRIELQGTSFDDPNRLFNSVHISFDCASTQKSDVRELIPEFYCFPEMFYNYNNFNLGEIKDINSNNMLKVENVQIPKWAQNSGYIFIKKHREFLESVEISNNINQWINLIFGSKQKGNEAKKIRNLFNAQTYEDFETEYDKSTPEDQIYLCRIVEFGVTPNQIFKNDVTKRREIDIKNKNKLFFNKELMFEEINNSGIKGFPYRIFYINKEKNKKNIYIFDYNNINKYSRKMKEEVAYNEEMKFIGGLYDDGIMNYTTIKKKFIECFENINLFNPKYGLSKKESPIEIFDNGKLIVIGGFWNGNIIIQKIEQSNDPKNNKDLVINTTFEYSPVTKIVIDKSETFAICTNKNGTLFIYKINPDFKFEWKLFNIINDSNCEITSMAINEQLNLFVTCDINGYVNLYTIPDFKLFNSFIIENNSIADFVFISQSPLALFVFYIKKSKKILFYSINGLLLSEHNLKYELKENYVKIYTDFKFIDYLMIYNQNSHCIELYNMVDFKLMATSPKIGDDFIDFCLDDDMNHLLVLTKVEDKNNYKVFLLNNKEIEINWE